MQKYTVNIGCSIAIDAENIAEAQHAVGNMIVSGFGPSLVSLNFQIYGNSPNDQLNGPSSISLSPA